VNKEAVQRAVVPLEEVAQPVEVAGADGEHEGVIGGGFVHGSLRTGIKQDDGGLHTDFGSGGEHGGRRSWVAVATGRTCRREKGYG
jgi:hypothetical protein